MIGRIALTLLAGVAYAGAQEIPARPEALQFNPLVFKMPEAKDYKAQLKNGIPVYIAPDPTSAFVRIQVMVRGGSYQDPLDKLGLAILTGGSMRSGGTLVDGPAELEEKLDFLAANVSANLMDTSGTVSLEVPAKDLDEGLKLMTDVLLRPGYAPDRLQISKRRFTTRMEVRNDSITSVHDYTRDFLLFGEHHYSTFRPTSASIASLTAEDLKARHAKILHPANFVVAISGQVERKQILDRLNTTLGALKPGKDAVVSQRPTLPPHTRVPGIYTVDKDAPQAVVSITLPGLRRSDPDWHAAEVMNAILGGGGFTARLMKKVRSDEGLTYGIYSNFDDGAYWRGDWTCQFQTANKTVAYGLRLTLAEIERMKKELVTDEELAVVKGAIVDGLPGDYSSKDLIARHFASEKLVGWEEDFMKDYVTKIQAVTREDVQRVARKYLDTSKAIILAVGKVAEVEKGDEKDHPGPLKDVAPLPMKKLPLRDPLTTKPMV